MSDDDAKERARAATLAVIAALGSVGPESVEQAVARLVKAHGALSRDLGTARASADEWRERAETAERERDEAREEVRALCITLGVDLDRTGPGIGHRPFDHAFVAATHSRDEARRERDEARGEIEDLGKRIARQAKALGEDVRLLSLIRAERDAARDERDEARSSLKQATEDLRRLQESIPVEGVRVRVALAALGAEIQRRDDFAAKSRDVEEFTRKESERSGIELADARLEIERLNRLLAEKDVVPRRDADSLRAQLDAVHKISSSQEGEIRNLRAAINRFSPTLNRLAREAGVYLHQTNVDDRGLRDATDAALKLLTEVPGVRHPWFDMASFFDAKARWSAETFGPGDRYQGVVAHIRKELNEVLAKPTDLVEWVDIVLLAIDGAWRSAGANGEAFVKALVDKDAKNRSRTWPDWRTLKPGEVSQHIEWPRQAPRLVNPHVTTDPAQLVPGTMVLFMIHQAPPKLGRIVGRSNHPSFLDDWYEVEHEAWTPGGPTRLLVHKDSMALYGEST